MSKGSKWHLHGWACLIGCCVLMMYYTTVSGWMLAYFFRFVKGTFTQCYYYTFPGTAVQGGRPSHPLRHFLQKTACFHVQDGGLPSSAPSGGSDFASGNRGIILGAVAQGFNRMGLFFKAVVLAAGANVLFNHLVAGHAGSVSKNSM